MLKKIWRDIRLTFVSEYHLRKKIFDNLSRFPEPHQDAVLDLATRHDRLAELAASFPALLFALAITKNEPCAKKVSDGIMQGLPLATLAEIGSVPFWMRKLPPEAFRKRLPKLPDDTEFRRRISNHLPGNADRAAMWLEKIGLAYKWCDEDFAIWLAKKINKDSNFEIGDKSLFRLALYAWFSQHPETDAGKLIETRWTHRITYTAADEALQAWRDDVRVHLLLDSVEPEKPWLEPHKDERFYFEPILSADAVIAESRAMHNCIRTYAEEIATREMQFWVIREAGKRVAHLSIGHRWGEPLPTITEIRGPHNKEVSPEVFRTAWRWFMDGELEDLRPRERVLKETPVNHKIWSGYWRPYWLEKKRLPQRLPMTPSLDHV